ncbi:aldehyde dehydrogenase family protein [Sphingobium sufflavum]|nr:aldehyde dehydrogenase family protein [Sphingobium sufflavum]MCE7795564.1 aldehyde dehydrogenase family protein [Sphingobium sufflavum]
MLHLAICEPYGVIVAITAWNSPVTLLANKLAAGNCVVVKPSEHASATMLEFARLVEQAGFPAGVVNVATGEAEVGKALVTIRTWTRSALPAARRWDGKLPQWRAPTWAR